MVRPEIIRKRLNKLDEYLAILQNARRYSWEEFVGDPERYGSVERFLHLSLETLQDMGNHVIIVWMTSSKSGMSLSGFSDHYP